MSSKIIVLDPGHGLNKQGQYSRPLIDCRGEDLRIINDFDPSVLDKLENVYREDFGTLLIAKAVQAELECMGHKVFLTRGDDRNAALWLAEKMNANEWKKTHWKSWKWIREFSKQKKSDMFVSIHTNAGGGTGCSAFWTSAPQGTDLCKTVTSEINKQLGLKIRRVAKHRYLILRQNSQGRAMLLECLFHDNKKDIQLVLEDKGIRKLGKAIATGIDNYTSTF